MHELNPLPAAKGVLRRALTAPTALAGRSAVALGGARAALLARPLLRGCTHVGLYCAMDGEVDTAPLAQLLWQDGCRLHLPVTLGRGERATLRFVAWTPDTPLARHPGGMLQPETVAGAKGAKNAAADQAGLVAEALDAVVLPGLAFDLRGGRLGRGWGCYDRALAGYGGLVVGLAHAYQLLATLPREAHDCGVDVVVTPVGVFPTASRRSASSRPAPRR